uniref:Methylsterol monooxygenase n=1 Tax=Tetraselmis sp. GSL018 TaxID=582737 RepID=A0A061SJU7_9CHLO
MFFHLASFLAFLGQLGGYVLVSTFLQSLYLRRYRVQAFGNMGSRTDEAAKGHSGALGTYWWLPAVNLFGNKPDYSRHPLHGLYCTINLLTEAHIRGWNNIKLPEPDTLIYLEWLPFLRATLAQSVLVYYWHRLMHWRPCYKALHKLHHFYKAPRPFDDLFIHPVEAFGYYTLLYLFPAHCLGRMPLGDYALYLTIHGVFGVLDHSGIYLSVPPFYHVSDHDAHHRHFNVNYAFPFVLMDIFHGTYRRGWRSQEKNSLRAR